MDAIRIDPLSAPPSESTHLGVTRKRRHAEGFVGNVRLAFLFSPRDDGERLESDMFPGIVVLPESPDPQGWRDFVIHREVLDIMIRSLICFTVVCACWNSAFSDGLGIGSPAPPLTLSRFVKGEPVKKFEAGKIYVVEFWATWCGPCKTSIPHLTKLAKKYPQIVFIGVDIKEPDTSAIDDMVKEFGEKMDYRVAVETHADGEKNGEMDQNWMVAADQPGIPTAFVISAEGKILCIEHPQGLDRPLSEIVAGTYDLAAATKTFLAKREKDRLEREHLRKLKELLETEPNSGLWAKFDKLVVEAPEIALGIKVRKITHAARSDEFRKKAIEWADELIGLPGAEPEMLNDIAIELNELETGSSDINACALRAVTRADRLSRHQDPAIIDTLARTLFYGGDLEGAIKHQKEAIKLSYAAGDPELITEAKQHLIEYQKAVDAAAKTDPKPAETKSK